MSSSLDGDCSPQKSAPMERDEGIRPLGERMCVCKNIFKHVKRLFAEATKVRQWMKTPRKQLYSLDSLGVSFEVLEEVALDWDLQF